jgi:hypothetical protein
MLPKITLRHLAPVSPLLLLVTHAVNKQPMDTDGPNAKNHATIAAS